MAIDNTLLRERFQRMEKIGEVNAGEVAVRCGWQVKDKRGRLKPDSTRVTRALGISADAGRIKTEVSEEVAEKLCRALHLDPWEVDL